MKRNFSHAMDDLEVVRTLEVLDDEGELVEKSVIRLGDRDVVLDQVGKSTAEAKEELDGLTAAGDEQPVAPTGNPGKSRQWFFRGKTAFCTEIERRADGKVAHTRTRPLGPKSHALAHAAERHKELEAERSGIEKAK